MNKFELDENKRFILNAVEDDFIKSERSYQNEIYGRDYRDKPASGFYPDMSELALFHTDDIDQIILIDGMEEGDEKENHYDHFKALAEYRHRNDLLMQMVSDFDKFADFADPESLIDRQECKEALIASQQLYAIWIDLYKEHITSLLNAAQARN